MDIIGSHRSGLIEQLEVEAADLAGRGRDVAQRVVVYHHVADMLGMAHVYALMAAEGALAIDEAVARMERKARRAYWRLKRAQRAALGERIAVFAQRVRRLDAERCAGLLMAYRLVATPGLGDEAARRLDPDLLAALRAALEARGAAGEGVRRRLFAAHQRWAEALIGDEIAQAVAELEWPLVQRALQLALDAIGLPIGEFERINRRGVGRIERRLRESKLLPAGFAANPAQAFFQLQRSVTERRRRAADVDHLTPDEAVMLAA